MRILLEVTCNSLVDKRLIITVLVFFLCVLPNLSIASNIRPFQHDEQNRDSLKTLAQEHHTWAVKHYSVPGMLDSVITRARMSLELRKKLWKENPVVDLGKSYHNLGAFLKIRGDLDEAKKYLNKAVSVYSEIGSTRVLRSILELGNIYKEEGDFVSAEEYYKSILQDSRHIKNSKNTLAAITNLGSTYIDSYRDTIAIDHLEKYIDRFDVTNMKNKVVNGDYYNNLGNAYIRNLRYEDAIRIFQKARLVDTSNYIAQAKIYSNLAIAYRMVDKFGKCYDALKRGQEMAYRSEDLYEMSFSHVGLAKYHQFRIQFDLALSEIQKAISLLAPSFKPENDFINPSSEDLSYIVDKILLLSNIKDKVAIVQAIDKVKYQDEILELYRLGDQVIDEMRSDHLSDDAKLYWRSTAFPFYESALQYCYEEGILEEAFYYFEKSKSVLLLEGYSFNEAITKTSTEDMVRYQKLKSDVSQLQKSKDSKSVEEIVNSQRSFEIFVDSLTKLYPQLFQKYNEQFLLSLADFQKEFVKDSSTIYIHYFYGEENVYAFGIEGTKTSFLDLGEAAKIDLLISNLRQFFLNSAQIDNDFDTYIAVSNELYKVLLEPLIEKGHKEIVLLPDGPISTIPFESLISRIDEDSNPRYVIQDRIIRYSFSGSILSNMKDSNERGADDVITFLPFTEKEQSQGANFSGVSSRDLKNAGLQVREFSGSRASKKNLLSYKGRLPILHFSSHGFEDEGKEPEMLLSNSSLSLSELFTSYIPADMVFLSACQTNLGDNVFGEGIQSMARGFTFAGANSVISSLWNVIAAPNSNIVRRFYINLSEGQTKHLALHNAKVAYLKDLNIPSFEKSPYYWAGMVYYGESDHILKPMQETGLKSWWLIGSLAMLLIVIFLGIKFFR